MPQQLANQNILDKISIAIDDFVKLTQIPTAFFNLTGAFVANQTIYESFAEVTHQYAFQQPLFFPVAIDFSLSGFIVCDGHHLTTQRVQLCRGYLEHAITKTFTVSHSVAVWTAISQKQGIGFSHLFENFTPTSKAKAQTAITIRPVATDATDPLNNITTAPQDTAQDMIGTTIHFIEQHLTESISLDAAAKSVFLSTSYLSRLFKRTLNINFGDYVIIRKIVLAQDLLVTTTKTIQEISKLLGFSQTSYFTRVFKQHTKLTPSAYRSQNTHVSKVYTIPRPLDCSDHDSVYNVTKRYLTKHHIKSLTQLVNGYPYIQSIGDLTNIPRQCGWIYLVDGCQPITPASEVLIANCAVIQWVYTDSHY
ncbi:helix-turn-helix domain-containing protein [Levilactobacillus brevis]|uniref:helix-turn-helix domain-containing protein n=1 Tax=Levilactobacillus brevis TaxID=1580 RepID=UPI0021A2E275|nr:helix-turn-helix domain-containing protein [Levilactobacillus brevis]MCT3567053.1 helix-turn-helix domain-containing protein [Levilactobacillus brevis]